MPFPIYDLPVAEFPKGLWEIPQPPKSLRYRGTLPPPDMTLLSVVGSRHYTNYGKQVVTELISGLKGYNIGIVSGLALGIDSLAHEAALSVGLYTLAIPGGGLDDKVIYPNQHRRLAHRIMEAKGGLLSEYADDFKATTWSFPQRNRLVAGISKATLLIEAADKSGTLITARLATDYNRELLVVPGSIFSTNSRGTHQFLKLGATPVTQSSDILEALNMEIEAEQAVPALPLNISPDETLILSLLHEPIERDTLIRKSNLPAQTANVLLMKMEMSDLIVSEQNFYRRKF